MGKYFGTYNRTLDAKGRLQIPSRLLQPGQKSFYVLRGFEGCLSVYEEEDFSRLMASLESLDFHDEGNRAFIRLTTSSMQEMPLDSHGRLTLGKETRDAYRIGDEVTIIGVIDHFEVWDEKAYDDYQSSHLGDYETLAKHGS